MLRLLSHRAHRFFQSSSSSSIPSSEMTVERVRKHLLNLHSAVCRLKNSKDETIVKRAILSLDELFLLCVVGEFNSGKSSLINRIVGKDVLRVGATPTTDRILALTSSKRVSSPSFLESEIETIGLSSNSNNMSWLSRGFIIDSPGTNAIVKGHQEISESLIPRADLIVFLTSADRPFTESERTFLNLIRSWRKHIIIVVNKIDLLKDDSERIEVREFVRDAARKTLGENVSDFMVSSLTTTSDTHDEFKQLEQLVHNTMSEESATMIKLESICGVGLKVLETHLKSCERRDEIIQDDVNTLNLLETQNENWQNDVLRDLEGQLQTVDSSLRDVVDRADDFFEDEFQITNIVSLLSGQTDGLRQKFETQVLGDSLKLVDDRTNDLIDWLMRKRSNQLKHGMMFLDDRVNRPRHDLSSNQELTDVLQNQIVVRKAYVRCVRETISFPWHSFSQLTGTSRMPKKRPRRRRCA